MAEAACTARFEQPKFGVWQRCAEHSEGARASYGCCHPSAASTTGQGLRSVRLTRRRSSCRSWTDERGVRRGPRSRLCRPSTSHGHRMYREPPLASDAAEQKGHNFGFQSNAPRQPRIRTSCTRAAALERGPSTPSHPHVILSDQDAKNETGQTSLGQCRSAYDLPCLRFRGSRPCNEYVS